LIAAAAVPEITKAVAALGAAKDVCIMDYIYQPMIKAGKGRNAPEKPDPHYPAGIRIQIPAWMPIVAAIVGVPLGFLVVAELRGQTGPLKEALGLKRPERKPGVLGWGTPIGL
jgi:hypothetical protein